MDYNYNYNGNMVDIDPIKLKGLGFNDAEIQQLLYVYNSNGKFTTNALQSYGYNYEQSKRLMYMYGICCGKVQVETKEQLIKHLRKMHNGAYKISIQDLMVSKVTDVPRIAIVGNIKEEPYNIWNSNKYKGKAAIYKVVDVTTQRITIETSRKPVLEYGKPKVLPGILEIKGVRNNGNAVVAFDKKYCKLCNRFIIVASLRNPEFHYGKYEVICFEGTKVYVYATNMGTRDSVRYSMGTQRVYDYGILPKDIKPKLDRVAKALYKHLHGVSVQYSGANSDYRIVPIERKEEDLEDGVIS